VIGLIFKIPLTNMLGDEGMGYFNTAYQIYTWLYMLSTAGLPVALSLMISEFNAGGRHRDSRRIFRLTLLLFSSIGLLGTLAMVVFSKNIARFISAELAYLCITVIAPALFFVCVSSAVRGYFQGHRNMLPTAVSEIIEAVCKMGIGITLGLYAIGKGYPLYRVAAYAILGVTVGVALGAIFLAITAAISSKNRQLDLAELDRPSPQGERLSDGRLLKNFLKIAIPVMLSSSLLSMSSMLDTMIIIRRLKETGLAEAAAVALYGNYTAYCVTLFNLPRVLIYPIVNTLIPSVSGM
jgi:stage V sporulation protein B